MKAVFPLHDHDWNLPLVPGGTAGFQGRSALVHAPSAQVLGQERAGRGAEKVFGVRQLCDKGDLCPLLDQREQGLRLSAEAQDPGVGDLSQRAVGKLFLVHHV